ncbi:MAG: 30S ribosomal protein S9 [Akkermansiaceae bacterium]|nr:30S ribosomal protein S9 [Akkermansia sp.]MCD7798023.1 30S ribosomal protein S9 [Akkermansiaceae bacterium]MCD8069809.1 30S ribosomal protein S9 [Akkermansiaceae bacterium]
MSQTTPFNATGRRKTAVAHAWLSPAEEGKSGKIEINRHSFEEYLPTDQLQNVVLQPFYATNTIKKYNVRLVAKGGGIHGQAGAMSLAIARSLVLADEENKKLLREQGLLTRDPRMKERKKAGRPGARKRFQFSKR